MALILLLTTDGEKTIEYPLFGKSVIGRSSSCDLTLIDKQMSGKHGVFEIGERGELYYTDLDSSNGSYLNNSKIQKTQFKISETLRVGNTSITIDENRLSSKERLAIGRGQSADGSNGKTIVLPPTIGKNVPDNSQNQKKSIILNKDLKKKQPVSDWKNEKAENIIEQEESSGATKMLKLDINKLKKK